MIKSVILLCIESIVKIFIDGLLYEKNAAKLALRYASKLKSKCQIFS